MQKNRNRITTSYQPNFYQTSSDATTNSANKPSVSKASFANKIKRSKLLSVGLFCLMILLYVGILCAITTPTNTQTPITIQALQDGDSGDCGKGVTYEFKITDTVNNLGTLTISLAEGYTTGVIDDDSFFFGKTILSKL